MEDRLDRTHREAMALIEAERKDRREKTERLRAMRLAAASQPAKVRRHKVSHQPLSIRLTSKRTAPMAKPKRNVFHSSLTKTGWVVTEGGETVSRHGNQKDAETAARKAGRKAHAKGGLGQAVLHKRDGTIREERTYGKDPERTPG